MDLSTYEQMMRSSVDALTGHGHRCVALSTCQGVPTYRFDDSQIATRMFAGMDVQIDREFHTPGELISRLSGTAIVVTTRMHLAILALIAGAPVIAVAYEFKTIDLFTSLGLSHAVIQIEDASSEWMRRAIDAALREPAKFTLSREVVEGLRDEASGPAEIIKNLGAASGLARKGPA